MKTWGFWARVVTSVGVTVLVFSFLLLPAFRVSGKRHPQSGVQAPLVATGGAARLTGPKEDPRWIEAYGKLPLSFEENQGQTAREVRYVSHGSGYELFLTPQEAVVALRPPIHLDFTPPHRFATLRALHEAHRAASPSGQTTTVRLQLDGANPQAQIAGIDRLPGKVNYFVGNDPKKWHPDVPTYAKVKYTSVYPGVDLVFYGNQRQLEYDFVVAPGADPKAIALKVDGTRELRINSRGDLVLRVPGGEVQLQKPLIYQEIGGQRRQIAGSYAIAGNHRVTFAVPNYDRSEPLVLDPVLNYSTFVGGSLNDDAVAIALDANNNAFITGMTTSVNFPVASAYQATSAPIDPNNPAIFVSELNPAGTQLLYSTYLSGTIPFEFAFGIAVDSTGKVYVTGQTASVDFPTNSVVTGFKTGNNPGANPNGTSFLVKFDPTKSGIASYLYSTYIGGTNGDLGEAVAADSNGVAYVTGFTNALPGTTVATFPVVNGFQTTLNNTHGNAFLAKIDTTKSSNALLYSTYLGGNGVNFAGAGGLDVGDVATGVAIDTSGNAYLVGTTSSTDFNTLGTTNGRFLTYPTGNTTDAAFFSKIDTTKLANQSLIYLSYLGGTGPEFSSGIALGPNNVAYFAGETRSTGTSFPVTPNSYPTTALTSGVAFISLIDTNQPKANSLTYSTLLGGTGTDIALGIRVDTSGKAYVAGATSSFDFPVSQGAFQPKMAAGTFGDGFVAQLNPGGNGTKDLLYSTYFGGGGDGLPGDIDKAQSIALDASNPPNVYITGQTFSTNFPTFGTPMAPLHVGRNGPSDAFVAKLTLIPTLAVSPAPGSTLDFGTVLIPNTSAPQMVTLTNNTNAAIAFTSATLTGANSADFTATPAAACIPSITTTTPCTVSVTFKPSVVGPETATLVLTDGDSTSPQSFTLKGSGTNTAPDFTLTGPTTTQTVKDGSTLTFQVTVTPIGGFKSAVAFTCTGAPALATCTAPSVTPTDGVTPVNSTVTVTTTAMLMPPPSPRTPPVSIRQIVPLVLALLLLFLLPRAQRLRTRLGMATAMILFIALAGCSGAQKPHTPTGPATLTITGTSGALSHPVTVNITVN